MLQKSLINLIFGFFILIASAQSPKLHLDYLVYENNNPNFVGLAFYIAKDTCISNLNYQFLSGSLGQIPDYTYSKIVIRFDSSKIYLRYRGNNQEYLLYDYNVKKGDTVHIYPPKIDTFGSYYSLPGVKQLKIVKLDTILLYYDTYRRTILFEGDTIIWIEGFGNINSFFLDPFGTDKSLFWNLKLSIYYFHDSCIIIPPAFPNRPPFKKFYSGYSNYYLQRIPFYFKHNCFTNTISDTVQLDTSECRRPYTFQNFTIKQSAYNHKCRDTVKLSLDIKYVPPSFTYKFVPDSFVVLKPPYDSMKTTLYTYVSNATCNKKITYYPTHLCVVCKDSVYKPFIVSNKTKDTLYCPDTLNHIYTIKSGNIDSSFSWSYLNPLPLIYGNISNYQLKVVAKNQYCIDTFTTDSLLLICDDSCKFKQRPCVSLFCNKTIASPQDTLIFYNACITNCNGYQFQWDNNKSTEILPANYSKTQFTKKLYYWNSFNISDSSSISIKIDLKNNIFESLKNKKQWIIENSMIRFVFLKQSVIAKLYNNLGMKIAENKIAIDISPLESGVYFLQIEDGVSIYLDKILIVNF